MITKPPTLVMFFLTISLLISGCGPGQFLGPTFTATSSVTPTLTPTLTATATATATLTPTLTPTFTPSATFTPLPRPQAGYWIGDTDFRKGSSDVNFNVDADGNIFDFKFRLIFPGFTTYTCTISAEIIKVQPDGTFKLVFGEALVQGMAANTIYGKFDSTTTASGSTAGALTCGDFSSFGDGSTWNAVWNRSVE